MALPSLDKTWQFNVNNIVRTKGALLSDNRALLRALKNALVGFGLGAWTVRYSCDSVAAGVAGDGVDRWAADTNLVWAANGSAHSWIVLRQTGVGATYEICFDLIDANSYSLSFIVATAGAAFTGGTTTARPTATGEIATATTSTTGWHGLGNSTYDCIWHVMMSTDGACTRIFINNYTYSVTMFMCFEAIKVAATGWTYPSATAWLANTSAAATYALLNDAANLKAYHLGSMPLYGTSEGIVSSMLGENRLSYNDFSYELAMTPIGLVSETANKRGRHGTLYDIWWGSTLGQTGNTYPDNNSRQFAQFGHLVVPWNGTNVIANL